LFEIVIIYYISNLCFARYQHNNSSDDEAHGEDEITLHNFPPFMATFRKQKSNLTVDDKKAWLESGIEECKANELLPFIIQQMFDFDIDESILAKDIFAIPEKMALVFNYMDSFFQIQPNNTEESFKKAAALMQNLRRFYDKRACLNTKHTESIIDVFRFCVRKDQLLSRMLERRVTVWETDEMKSETAQEAPTTNPQQSDMDVEAQSKMDLLLKKKVFTTSFEDSFDSLQGDGQQLLNEFVDWPVAGEVYSYNELKNELCGDAKFKFDGARIWLSGLVWSYTDSKKAWTSRTIDLEDVEFQRHPKTLDRLFETDMDSFEVFDFQRSMSIEAINHETMAIDRKAHMFWEFPEHEPQINKFMESISTSGSARKKILMTGDTKDAKNFYAAKKQEFEENISFELSFIDSLYMMHSLRKKIQKAQAEATAFDNIRQYSHNFGDFVFYKAMNFRSHYLETIAEDKNKELNLKVRRQAAEYFIEVLFLQYNTLLYNCEKYFHEIIHFRLFNEFIVPLFDGKMYDQYLVILMVRSLANVILRRIWVQLLLLREKTLHEEANALRQKEVRQEKQMASLAMSAREQIQQQVEKEMEPKLELLLAQQVKPHAIRKKENKEPVFRKERNVKRKSSNITSATKSNLKRRNPKFRVNRKTMRLHFLNLLKKNLVLNYD